MGPWPGIEPGLAEPQSTVLTPTPPQPLYCFVVFYWIYQTIVAHKWQTLNELRIKRLTTGFKHNQVRRVSRGEYNGGKGWF